MAVPTNLIPTRITQLPLDPAPSGEGWLIYVRNGVTYRVQAADILDVSGVPPTRQVLAGTGLDGGGTLATDITLGIAPGGVSATELDATGVTPGTYGASDQVPVLAVDANGRVTSAGSTPVTVSGYVPETRQVIAGAGLSGGGQLTGDVTLNADLAATTPLPGSNAGAVGTAETLARADHIHPAVDLADQTQINGILPIDQGGTGRSLVMNPGAIVWSGADGLYVGSAGNLGQVLVSDGADGYSWGAAQVYSDQPANYVLAGPTSGPDATAAFRLLVNADIPTALSGKTIDDSVIGGTTPAAGTFTSLDAQYLDLVPNLNPLPANQTARLYYDNSDQVQTVVFQMNGNVIQHVGEAQFYRVKCQGTITKGQVVMFAGTVGASGGLIAAAATGLQPEQANYVMGVADESGVNNDWIFITNFGEVKNINTTGTTVGETWLQGDVLYYNPAVAGGLTKVKPAAPNAIVVVAAVVHVGSSNGIIFVRPTYGSVLGGTDGNVQFGTLADNDLIVYNGATSRWENYAPAAARTALGLGNVENTALSTWSGSTNLTTLGTVTTGTWNATAIADGKIASALTGKTYNGLSLVANATGFSVAGGATSKTLTISNSMTLAGTDGTVLNIGTGGTLGSAAFTASTAYEPAFTTLAVSKGGTGLSTLTANNVILGNGTSTPTFVAPGASGNVLISNGTTWTSAALNAVLLSANNAFIGANTFYNNTGQTFGTATATQDGVVIAGRAGGTSSFRVTIQPATLSASRVVTLPNANTTIPVASQVLTFTGPTAARTYTLPDADATLLATSSTISGGTF